MKFKRFIIVFLLLILFLGISAVSYANEVFTGLSDNIFRLHILANSDSDEDQALKLKVRDAVIEYLEGNFDSSSKEETIQILTDNLDQIQEIAEQVIAENGYDYTVTLEIGNFYFPTKYYGNISLPAGNYDALRIKIGKAEGQNWWCSLFPPLCFIDISSGYLSEEDSEILEENLTDEEFEIISSSSPDIKLKFKILELLNEE